MKHGLPRRRAALRVIYPAPSAQTALAALETVAAGPSGRRVQTIGTAWRRAWPHVIEAFDEVYDHILNMSDTLAEGIVKQFPEQFTGK